MSFHLITNKIQGRLQTTKSKAVNIVLMILDKRKMIMKFWIIHHIIIPNLNKQTVYLDLFLYHTLALKLLAEGEIFCSEVHIKSFFSIHKSLFYHNCFTLNILSEAILFLCFPLHIGTHDIKCLIKKGVM